MHFKVFQRVRKEKQAKYGSIKVENFVTILLKNGGKTMTYIKTLKFKIYTHMAAESKMFILIC